jgi:hypothetical protein
MDTHDYLCPIGRDLLLDPVIADDGYFYNRHNLTTYFGKSKTKNSPITGCKISTRYTASKQFKNIIIDLIKFSSTLDHLIADLTINDIFNCDLENIPKISLNFPENFDEIFSDAINSDNEELALKILLTRRVNNNYIDSGGCTALARACNKNMPKVALKLLEYPDILYNHINNKGCTALIWACSKNMPEVALKLLEYPDILRNHIDSKGCTALIYACSNDAHEIALKLLEYPDILYNHISNKGCTALIHACSNNMPDVALKLLEYPDILHNHVDNDEDTALILACRNKMYHVINAIVARELAG